MSEPTRPLPRMPPAEMTGVMPKGLSEKPVDAGAEVSDAEAPDVPLPESDSKQIAKLVEQVRRTGDARFRSFLSGNEAAAASARRAGGESSGRLFREIARRSEELVSALLRRVRKIEAGAATKEPSVRSEAAELVAFAQETEARVDALEPFVGPDRADRFRQEVATFRGMAVGRALRAEGAPADEASERDFRDRERSIRRTEIAFEFLSIQDVAVPTFLGRSPKAIYEDLRGGVDHPRNRLEVALGQLDAFDNQREIERPEDTLAAYLPERVREPFHVLRSEQIPPAHREEANRAANMLLNGCFGEAARATEALRERLADGTENGRDAAWFLEPMVAEIRETEKGEATRLEKLADVSRSYYEASIADPGETSQRREFLRRRMERENQLRTWDVVDIEPMVAKPNKSRVVEDANSPVVVTLRNPDDPTQSTKAVMKFDFSDRFARSGVSPGTGSLREAVGALAQAAMRSDIAPAIVSRATEDYGRVTIMDYVPGDSCLRKERWFLAPSGEPHPDLAMNAMRGLLLGTTDEHARNLMDTGSRLLRIDFGSDFAAPKRRDPKEYNSATHYAAALLGQPVGAEVIGFLEGWNPSRGRTAIAEAIALLPDDMDGFIESVDAAAAQLLAAVKDPPHAFLPYPEDGGKDLGNRFLKQLDEHVGNKQRASQAGGASDNKMFKLV